MTARSVELRSIAQAIADALPTTVLEVVLTGSVSRGSQTSSPTSSCCS
jgi:hypothetical protein